MILTELKPKEKAIITKIKGPSWLKTSLNKMGVEEGMIIQLMLYAPFSSPVQLKIKNYYVALRKKDAKFLEVEKID